MRSLVMLAVMLCTTPVAHAAVLCVRPRSDGTFNASVKIREVCKAREVQLQPQDVGFCCLATTTSTTTSSSTTMTTGTLPEVSTTTTTYPTTATTGTYQQSPTTTTTVP